MTLWVLSFAEYETFLSSFSKKNQKSLTFESQQQCKSQLFFVLTNFPLLPLFWQFFLISYLSGLLYVSTKQKFLDEGISSYLSGWRILKSQQSQRKELVFPLQLGYCPPAGMVLATNFYDRCFASSIPYYAALICVHTIYSSTLCRLHHYQASSPTSQLCLGRYISYYCDTYGIANPQIFGGSLHLANTPIHLI